MSTRGKVLILFFACLPIVSAYIILSNVLTEPDDSPTFKGYDHVLPNVTYETIIADFDVVHKTTQVSAEQAARAKTNLESDDGFINFFEIDMPAFSGDAVINESYSDTSRELNLYLYALCQLYANDMYCGDIKLSPLLALAEANLEGGRVNTSVTFSGVAPSSVFQFTCAEDLHNLNVTDCLRDEETWIIMASEYYTRDRGALQCNPDYGFDREYYGASERELLDAYVLEQGMPDYKTLKDTRGNKYNVEDWIDYSRTMHGDRFNPESLIKMFADVKREVECPSIARYFPDIQNEFHVYGIMSYNHWCGTGYMTMDEDMAYSGFATVGRSKEYLRDITSPKAIEVIYSQCLQEIQDARAHHRNPVRCCDNKAARRIFDILHEEGVCKSWDYYFRHKYTGDWDQGVTACGYPLGVIYGVMQMNLLYSGY